MIQQAYKESREHVIGKLMADPANGLSASEAVRRLEQFGPNTLREKKKQPLIVKILNQFKDVMVLILIAATIISAFLGEILDAAVILAIVVINAVLGVVQEGRAERAIEALMKLTSPQARVIRDGKQQIIEAADLVPGDLVLLETGDIVPADIRLLESASMKAEEASLTGESVPVEKSAEKLFTEDAALGDQCNMAFMSTPVTAGRGRGLVSATGRHTVIGSIADRLQDIGEEATPLKRSLNKLGKVLGVICLAVCAVVFVEGILMGGAILAMFMTAISLAVAAIPEGLPAVVTIVLALGMKRMADRNAIVKRLLAVETLGCVDVICSDKTGTLTQNEMTVTRLYVPGQTLEVEGRGYAPEGRFLTKDTGGIAAINGRMRRMLLIGALCSEATLTRQEGGGFGIIGDPTEGALVVAAAKAGLKREDLQTAHPRVNELPFDSERKMMTTFHGGFPDAPVVSFTKGAPDIVLASCKYWLSETGPIPLDGDLKASVLAANQQMAEDELRVLGFAYKLHKDNYNAGDAEKGMIFVGLAGMIDPPRPEARDAINVCNEAGIRAVMITGDYRGTAVAIARDLGLMAPGAEVLDGREMDGLSDEELQLAVERTSVYARVSPDHKVRIVTALKKNEHIVSMTGDGVNDALALKTADIGVAMGVTGTDVAKGTSDMILTDDNFATIVSAVHEGRILYSNIRKFVGYLLSCNVAEILVIFITTLILGSHFVPLLPIQLLWLNLITDSFPALALGQEKGEPDIMKHMPRKANEPILNGVMARTIAIQSAAIFLAVFAAFQLGIAAYPGGASGASDGARTFAFTTLILSEIIRSFSARSEKIPVLRLGLLKNSFLNKAFLLSLALLLVVIYVPFLNPVFSTVSLTLPDWAKILPLSLVPFAAAEIDKWIRMRQTATHSRSVAGA